MYKCFNIANEFLDLANKEGRGTSPLKLLKLTYIAHGFYLGIKHKPLISDEVQAWKYGPVIPELYYVIRPFGRRNVDKKIIELYVDKELKTSDKDFISVVWKHYKNISGEELSNRTHEEGTPWSISYIDGINMPISNDIIENYYIDFLK